MEPRLLQPKDVACSLAGTDLSPPLLTLSPNPPSPLTTCTHRPPPSGQRGPSASPSRSPVTRRRRLLVAASGNATTLTLVQVIAKRPCPCVVWRKQKVTDMVTDVVNRRAALPYTTSANASRHQVRIDKSHSTRSLRRPGTMPPI